MGEITSRPRVYEVRIGVDLARRFTSEMIARFPRKSFGYFLAEQAAGDPVDYLVLESNVRNEHIEDFLTYGQYFADHHDAGFRVSAEETWKAECEIRSRGLVQVGVFHSHQRHPGVFAIVDARMHPAPELWHMLVVLRNLAFPQLRIFDVDSRSNVTEVPLVVVPDQTGNG